MAAATKHIEGHTQMAIAEAQAPLTSAMSILSQCAGGAAAGKEWKVLLEQQDPSHVASKSAKMKFNQLEQLTKDTLQTVDTQILVKSILETHTVQICCT